MKKEIHPKYGPSTIQCACGNLIETRSVLSRIQVDVCSSCHPFFTGKQKIMDTAGRIDRFKKKFQSKVIGAQKAVKKSTKPVRLSLKPKGVDLKKEKLQALKAKVQSQGK